MIRAEVGAVGGVGVVDVLPEGFAHKNVVVLSWLVCSRCVGNDLVVVLLEVGVGDDEVLRASP